MYPEILFELLACCDSRGTVFDENESFKKFRQNIFKSDVHIDEFWIIGMSENFSSQKFDEFCQLPLRKIKA